MRIHGHDRPILTSEDWTALHGFILALGFVPVGWLPAAWRTWPVPLLLPLAIYLASAATFAPLRRTVRWAAIGHLSRPALLLTAATLLVSSGGLLAYDAVFRPDLADLDRYAALDFAGSVAVSFVVFCLANAVIEEVVFRGILFQAFEARTGPRLAALATAVLFGLGHAGGYPPGAIGAVLAGTYGLALGYVRWRSGGLLLAILAHVCADATILAIRIGRG